eukprot:g2297.t1
MFMAAASPSERSILLAKDAEEKKNALIVKCSKFWASKKKKGDKNIYAYQQKSIGFKDVMDIKDSQMKNIRSIIDPKTKFPVMDTWKDFEEKMISSHRQLSFTWNVEYYMVTLSDIKVLLHRTDNICAVDIFSFKFQEISNDWNTQQHAEGIRDYLNTKCKGQTGKAAAASTAAPSGPYSSAFEMNDPWVGTKTTKFGARIKCRQVVITIFKNERFELQSTGKYPKGGFKEKGLVWIFLKKKKQPTTPGNFLFTVAIVGLHVDTELKTREKELAQGMEAIVNAQMKHLIDMFGVPSLDLKRMKPCQIAATIFRGGLHVEGDYNTRMMYVKNTVPDVRVLEHVRDLSERGGKFDRQFAYNVFKRLYKDFNEGKKTEEADRAAIEEEVKAKIGEEINAIDALKKEWAKDTKTKSAEEMELGFNSFTKKRIVLNKERADIASFEMDENFRSVENYLREKIAKWARALPPTHTGTKQKLEGFRDKNKFPDISVGLDEYIKIKEESAKRVENPVERWKNVISGNIQRSYENKNATEAQRYTDELNWLSQMASTFDILRYFQHYFSLEFKHRVDSLWSHYAALGRKDLLLFASKSVGDDGAQISPGIVAADSFLAIPWLQEDMTCDGSFGVGEYMLPYGYPNEKMQPGDGRGEEGMRFGADGANQCARDIFDYWIGPEYATTGRIEDSYYLKAMRKFKDANANKIKLAKGSVKDLREKLGANTYNGFGHLDRSVHSYDSAHVNFTLLELKQGLMMGGDHLAFGNDYQYDYGVRSNEEPPKMLPMIPTRLSLVAATHIVNTEEKTQRKDMTGVDFKGIGIENRYDEEDDLKEEKEVKRKDGLLYKSWELPGGRVKLPGKWRESASERLSQIRQSVDSQRLSEDVVDVGDESISIPICELFPTQDLEKQMMTFPGWRALGYLHFNEQTAELRQCFSFFEKFISFQEDPLIFDVDGNLMSDVDKTKTDAKILKAFVFKDEMKTDGLAQKHSEISCGDCCYDKSTGQIREQCEKTETDCTSMRYLLPPIQTATEQNIFGDLKVLEICDTTISANAWLKETEEARHGRGGVPDVVAFERFPDTVEAAVEVGGEVVLGGGGGTGEESTATPTATPTAAPTGGGGGGVGKKKKKKKTNDKPVELQMEQNALDAICESTTGPGLFACFCGLVLRKKVQWSATSANNDISAGGTTFDDTNFKTFVTNNQICTEEGQGHRLSAYLVKAGFFLKVWNHIDTEYVKPAQAEDAKQQQKRGGHVYNVLKNLWPVPNNGQRSEKADTFNVASSSPCLGALQVAISNIPPPPPSP